MSSTNATVSPAGLPGLSLEHLFTLECSVGTPLVVGDSGLGELEGELAVLVNSPSSGCGLGGSERRVIPITGGRFNGQINGECMNLGFDALLMQDNMTAR